MGKNYFRILYLILAVIFTFIAVKALMTDNFIPTYILPALVAISLIVLGIKEKRSA